MKINKSTKYIFLMSMLIANNAYAQLTGEIRRNFVDSTLQSCYNNQRSSKINAKISDQLIYDYCKCIAIYSANVYTNQIIKDVESGKRAMSGISEIANLAGNYCAKQLAK
jgi:hypothetical protein